MPALLHAGAQEIAICDAQGRIVMRHVFSALIPDEHAMLDISSLPSGTYMLLQKNGSTAAKFRARFIISR